MQYILRALYGGFRAAIERGPLTRRGTPLCPVGRTAAATHVEADTLPAGRSDGQPKRPRTPTACLFSYPLRGRMRMKQIEQYGMHGETRMVRSVSSAPDPAEWPWKRVRRIARPQGTTVIECVQTFCVCVCVSEPDGPPRRLCAGRRAPMTVGLHTYLHPYISTSQHTPTTARIASQTRALRTLYLHAPRLILCICIGAHGWRLFFPCY